MARYDHLTPKERNGRGLDLIGIALRSYVDERMRQCAGGAEWLSMYERRESGRRGHPFKVTLDDPRALLRILRFERHIFTEVDATQRAWIDELIQWSNKAAHTTRFTQAEADRSLDTMALLAGSLSFHGILDDLTILRASGVRVRDETEVNRSDCASTVSREHENVAQESSGSFACSVSDSDVTAKSEVLLAQSCVTTPIFISATPVPMNEIPRGTRALSVRSESLDVVVLYRDAINYALVHNGVSPIVAIHIRNRVDASVDSIVLQLSFVSPFEDIPIAGDLHVDVGSLKGMSETEIASNFLAWRLTTRAFLKFDESLSVDMELRMASSEGNYCAQAPVRLLPYNEWWASSIPEALAAFVRPNDSAVVQLVDEAMSVLERKTGAPSLLGYQAGPEYVYQIAEAIYDVIVARQITYVEPPPSFEGTGQRIRSHAEVLNDRRGTCLDLACTYAAALEYSGLHPILVLCKGHAFAGYLTDDAQLGGVAIDTSAGIRTVVDSDLFDGVETTAVTAGDTRTFDNARGAVRSWWSRDIGKVKYLLDVSRAHRVVRPLPSVRVEDGQTIVEEVREVVATPPRKTPNLVRREDAAISDSEEPARIVRWRRSLLDMSYNNPLLKLKKASAVPIHVPTGMLAELEDAVADGKSFTLVPHDELAELHRAQGARTAADVDSEVITQILRDELRLYAALSRSEYQRFFRTMARRAQTGVEETGVNSLYLALGTLEWKERGKDGKAPLFLVPIKFGGGRGTRPYTVELDDTREVQPNYCLIEKLRVSWGLNIPVLLNPGEDDAGLDVTGSLASIRSQLLRAELMEFHIEETAHIALLQFSTLEMWRDLGDNWQSFMKRSVVRHLVETPGQTFLDNIEVPAVSDKDEVEMYLPIPADGSQIEAIRWAAAGKSFILEGPPGTGKSQTITNLIAHLLAEGKKVLFVAEKQAALEVVRRRLDAVGLGEFSLDLHGRNQTVSTVRTALRAALDEEPIGAPSWEHHRAAYRGLVEFLGQYPEHLHEEGPVGLSSWEAWQIVLQSRDLTSTEPVEVPRIAVLGTVELDSLYNESRRLATSLSALGVAPQASPWKLAGALDAEAIDAASVAERLYELDEAYRALCASPVVELAKQATTVEQLGTISEWCGLGAFARLPKASAFLVTPEWEAQTTAVLAACANFVETNGSYMQSFSPEILDQDLNSILVRAEAADKKFFGRKRDRLAVAAEIKPFMSTGWSMELGQVSVHVRAIQHIQEQLFDLRRLVTSLFSLEMNPNWNPLRSQDFDVLSESIRAIRVSARLNRAFEENGNGGEFSVESSTLTYANSEAERLVREFCLAWESFTQVLNGTTSDLPGWLAGRSLTEAVGEAIVNWKADAANQSFIKLRRWARVKSSFAVFQAFGITSVEERVWDGSLRPVDLENAVRAGVAKAVLEERLDSTGLIAFDEVERASNTERFVLGSGQIREQLVTELPARIVRARTFRPGQRAGTVAKLEQQLGRRRGGMTIRGLLSDFGPVITEITPCFLMSPNSVARFLPADAIDFDVVVFDEASQIRVPDAIGAMGRAQAVVIVGDSQQMPPSSMFASVSNDDVEDEVTVPVDMESILSEAVESKLPSLLLSWHYRSRDESLIAFSNQAYYDGRLSSFPSPPSNGKTRAISLVNVHGEWEGGGRGASRVNRAEARAIVGEIEELVRQDPLKSLGVVTFNSQQRDLVLDMLESLRETNEAIDTALTRLSEPLFVKNLENVQGDERDIILFSLAFAKSENGKVPLNWGPLTRPGGENRLNVAITRAKEQVKLFSSFEPNELNLATSHSVGLAHLKDYLLSARSDIQQNGAMRQSAKDLHLEGISQALVGAGLEVQQRVGLSDFTVEIAVRAPGQGWLAVLLDGPNWAARSTVGDRDGLPQTILTESMGWQHVYRLWLPTWIRDSSSIVELIKEICLTLPVDADDNLADETIESRGGLYVENLDHEVTSRPVALVAELDKNVDAGKVPSVSLAEQFGLTGIRLPAAALPEPSYSEKETHNPSRDSVFDLAHHVGGNLRASVATRESRATSNEITIDHLVKSNDVRKLYVPYQASSQWSDPVELERTSHRAREAVKHTLLEIVNVEGPILIDRLLRLLALEYGISRLRESRRAELLKRVPPESVQKAPNGDEVVWPSSVDRAAYASYRVPEDGDRRDVLDIPYVELRNAMVAVVRGAYSMEEDDVLRETAREFGITRLASRVRPRLEGVLQGALREGVLFQQTDATYRVRE